MCKKIWALFLTVFLAIPLAGQSPVGTWATDLERHAAFGPDVTADITEQGAITFRPDHTYAAARKWVWLEDGLRTGLYAYAEGTWRVTADTLCVQREDVGRAACQPFAVTGDTLRWGAFTFTRGE